MKLHSNKPLRNLGIYKLRDKTLILWKQSEELSFLFTLRDWPLHGPVSYRVSHGAIYSHGRKTEWIDEDLVDTGATANLPGGLPM